MPNNNNLEEVLKNLGMDPKLISLIANSIKKYIETGEPIMLGNDDIAKLRKEN